MKTHVRLAMTGLVAATLSVGIAGAMTGAFAQAPQMAPNGTFVGGQPQMAPNGTFVGGQPQMAPNGTWVGGQPQMAPNGTWVGGQRR
jgi:hypothetical protein